ncbi:MAG TPA: hypothetical protein VMY05_11270 [Acidobacteriota bacterium]|nr:hypothetical protein [Acidobacteriota bacterium]
MVEQAKPDADEKSEKTAERGKFAFGGSVLKYVAIGVVAVGFVAVVVVGTLLVVGTDKTPASAVSEAAVAASTDKGGAAADAAGQDSTLAQVEEDSGVIEDIMNNLEFLDYKPTSADMAEDEQMVMTVSDSAKAADWLKTEKARLTKKEEGLNTRERELNILDKKVTQKILTLEQAESSRIASLAKLYDGMEPRAVAKLIANLDDETVVAILPRMKIKNASEVLALMPAKRGARLSKQMITIAEK